MKVLMKYKENQKKDLGFQKTRCSKEKEHLPLVAGSSLFLPSRISMRRDTPPPNTGGLPSSPVALWRLTKLSEVNLEENAGHVY